MSGSYSSDTRPTSDIPPQPCRAQTGVSSLVLGDFLKSVQISVQALAPEPFLPCPSLHETSLAAYLSHANAFPVLPDFHRKHAQHGCNHCP